MYISDKMLFGTAQALRRYRSWFGAQLLELDCGDPAFACCVYYSRMSSLQRYPFGYWLPCFFLILGLTVFGR